MTERRLRGNAYLRVVIDGRDIIAAAVRERSTTQRRDGVVTTARWWFAITALIVALAACGGGTKTDTYARGTQVQQACCEHLAGPARDACLKDVIRVGDPAAAQTATNQQTFACIVEHFVCDPRTGHETPASAQAQHDCTDDIP